MTSSITSTPYGISVSRAITRETASDVPSAIADLAAPFRAVYEEMDFYAPLEASPSVVAVLEAYPKLLGLLEVEVAAYVQAYADKCDELEDKLSSLRLQITRQMQARMQ